MKSIKRAVSFISAAALSLGILASCGKGDDSAAEAKKREFKDMTAQEYVREMGIGENLGNTFEAYWSESRNATSGCKSIGENTPLNYETCWGAVETTKEVIDGMKASGFSTVRVPVYWGNMMENDGEFKINADYMARVKQVVDWVIDDDLYCVINIHHYDEFIIKNKPQDEALAAFKTVWTQIAEEFKDYDHHLIFEGYNENVGTTREEDRYTESQIYDYVNALNQTFVDAVRATGGNNPKRLLIASGYWTNIDNTTKDSFKMPTDTVENKLMVSVHYIDNAMYWTDQIGGEKWKEYSKSQCELLKAAFTDKGIPVFVGETTSIYDGERFLPDAEVKTSSECLEYILTMAQEYGFITVLWDVNDNFYSRTEYKIKSETDAAVITKIAELIKNS
ncbi:MAG: glycoside hydrolase family 5 protein [Ruminococcus sp.]|nr:glycoside hydrolase family 5 protein [Ruminococcus sp.]